VGCCPQGGGEGQKVESAYKSGDLRDRLGYLCRRDTNRSITSVVIRFPTYWFRSHGRTTNQSLGPNEIKAGEYYQSLSLRGVALGITPSVQVVGIPGRKPPRQSPHNQNPENQV